jgi:hypothetical protein
MTLKIKIALVHPAASNGVCSHQRSRYSFFSKNQLFSFADMIAFLPDLPDSEHILL